MRDGNRLTNLMLFDMVDMQHHLFRVVFPPSLNKNICLFSCLMLSYVQKLVLNFLCHLLLVKQSCFTKHCDKTASCYG